MLINLLKLIPKFNRIDLNSDFNTHGILLELRKLFENKHRKISIPYVSLMFNLLTKKGLQLLKLQPFLF